MDASKKAITQRIQSIIKDETLNNLIPEIIDSFNEFSLSKNEFLVKKGDPCRYFCFVESGILQYAVTVSGQEKTTYLALRNGFASSLKSFLQQTPSPKNIKALSACKLWVLKINDFKHLMKNNKAFHQFYYNFIENQIFLIDDYRIDLLTLTPEERYKKLLVNEPKLLQEVPLHYLASFLGISTRHMSRIRKNIN